MRATARVGAQTELMFCYLAAGIACVDVLQPAIAAQGGREVWGAESCAGLGPSVGGEARFGIGRGDAGSRSDVRAVSHPAFGPVCHVLREDPDLAAVIPRADRDRAIAECTAPTLRIRRSWRPERTTVPRGAIGLLVLQGLLMHRVGIDGRFGAELLGEGDLLQPWRNDDVQSLPYGSDWRVLAPTRVAVLDRRATERFARYPALSEELVARALARARRLAVNLAIVQHPRVHVRLLMVFWHLAARWAQTSNDIVYLPLPLTHAALGELVAARRPSVTRALSELAERRQVTLVDGVWLLSAHPPPELSELRAAAGQALG